MGKNMFCSQRKLLQSHSKAANFILF